MHGAKTVCSFEATAHENRTVSINQATKFDEKIPRPTPSAPFYIIVAVPGRNQTLFHCVF